VDEIEIRGVEVLNPLAERYSCEGEGGGEKEDVVEKVDLP